MLWDIGPHSLQQAGAVRCRSQSKSEPLLARASRSRALRLSRTRAPHTRAIASDSPWAMSGSGDASPKTKSVKALDVVRNILSTIVTLGSLTLIMCAPDQPPRLAARRHACSHPPRARAPTGSAQEDVTAAAHGRLPRGGALSGITLN